MREFLVTAKDFHELFLQKTPFLDVRAEDEFAKGSIPHSMNLPILNNSERHLVGTCYKRRGQQAAIELGHKLVCGEIKASRIRNWCKIAAKNSNIHLYCWRGGMRSKLARQWMSEMGVDVPLIEGGYKALRRSLIEVIDEVAGQTSVIRIGGKTGVAKTRLIDQIESGVNLEKYANHRGSSFGRMVSPQPTQSNFEHDFAIDLLRIRHKTIDPKVIFVEDESRNIGVICIPKVFFNVMQCAPLVLLEMPFEFRVQHIMQEYIIGMLENFVKDDAQYGFNNFSKYLQESLMRIQKRLGMERYKNTIRLLTQALQTQLRTGSFHGHEAWITVLLKQYYDPMYEYQISKNEELIIFRGNYTEVYDWTQRFSAKRVAN